ncbi:MAG: putative hook-associated protein [Saliniramus fredricksonii]|uniref:Flagellin n=1 Tax=Saliniramus fredricksonii TaxID=1653334 RepID=A0A0N8KER3_9HYPH|nr:flagellin [Saliniramus fredricksonii]KPQ12058.1 MAG: putative hook-associated protein [Saliniramus fredricksonii]SCC81448.1 Flagellin FlgL [Saliniramus fredricksonii]
MSAINLSAGVRSNLLSLQGTAGLLEQTQNRLATGKKVNGPLDDAAAFFTAQGLNSRANDLSSITQGMQNGMKTIDAASKGIDSISTTMETMIGQVRQALQDPGSEPPESAGITAPADDSTAFVVEAAVGGGAAFDVTIATGDLSATDQAANAQTVVDAINGDANFQSNNLTAQLDDAGTGFTIVNESGQEVVLTEGASSGGTIDAVGDLTDARQALMNSYNDLRTELNALSADSGYNGNNLLMGDALEVVFNELTGDDRTSFTVSAKQADGTAFGNVTADRLGGAEGDATTFASNVNLESRLEALQSGVSELRSLSSQLGTAQTIVENRESFTKEMVNTLQAGADGLTLADMNEEAANNLALQTKQQLGQSALGLAIQNDQSVLQLLR